MIADGCPSLSGPFRWPLSREAVLLHSGRVACPSGATPLSGAPFTCCVEGLLWSGARAETEVSVPWVIKLMFSRGPRPPFSLLTLPICPARIHYSGINNLGNLCVSFQNVFMHIQVNMNIFLNF